VHSRPRAQRLSAECSRASCVVLVGTIQNRTTKTRRNFHLTETGVYATMLKVCLRNDRDRGLILKFMDAVGSVPHKQSTVDIALTYVFKIPENIVIFQKLIYNVCQQPCTQYEFYTTYSKYCMLTQKIFECVENDVLSFSDLEQFEASKWMICNLEAMMHLTYDHDFDHMVQAAICTHMNMCTIGKLYQEGYIQRLCETGAQEQDFFHDLVRRWNERPNNQNPWTLDKSTFPYSSFLGLSPETP